MLIPVRPSKGVGYDIPQALQFTSPRSRKRFGAGRKGIRCGLHLGRGRTVVTQTLGRELRCGHRREAGGQVACRKLITDSFQVAQTLNGLQFVAYAAGAGTSIIATRIMTMTRLSLGHMKASPPFGEASCLGNRLSVIRCSLGL